MHKHLFKILGILILFSSSCKKDLLHWQKVQQLSSGTNVELNRIKFLNDSLCIISGGVQYFQSEVVRSVDGGYTWTSNSYAAAPLGMYGLCTSQTGTIYMCGTYGRTLYSRDNGVTFQPGRITDYLQYVGASFPTPDTGIFISTVLQRQSTITLIDSDFNILSEQTFLFGLNNIYMVNDSVGYAIGYGAALKTTNRGASWSFLNVQGDNFESLDIHGSELFMCGFEGSVYHSNDGGTSWECMRNGNDFTQIRYNMLSIVFKDSNNGWISCDNGYVLYTNDGGHHWEQYDPFTTGSLRSIVICPNNDLLVAGDNGAIYRLTAN